MIKFKWMSIFLIFHLSSLLKLFNFNSDIFTSCTDVQQSQEIIKNTQILPFTSIKMINDDIFFTLSLHRDKWHKLLSIDNVGTDALVKYSKDHYGRNKCDYQIDCYRYNIIANFPEIFSGLQNKKFPVRVGLEYEEDNKIQTGIDVEATNENFKINENSLAENFKQSVKESNHYDNYI